GCGKLFASRDSWSNTGNYEAVKRPGNPFNYPLGMTWLGKPTGRPSDGYVLTDVIALFFNTSAPPTYSLWEKKFGSESDLKYGMNFAKWCSHYMGKRDLNGRLREELSWLAVCGLFPLVIEADCEIHVNALLQPSKLRKTKKPVFPFVLRRRLPRFRERHHHHHHEPLTVADRPMLTPPPSCARRAADSTRPDGGSGPGFATTGSVFLPLQPTAAAPSSSLPSPATKHLQPTAAAPPSSLPSPATKLLQPGSFLFFPFLFCFSEFFF
ncbi:hypothetical protein Tsubulata_035452, partial [Turnera subulata]